MARMTWYQVNIYPTTQRGVFTVAVMQNTGFHYHCRRHQKNRCKDCVDFGHKSVVRLFHDVPSERTDLDTVLQRAMEAIAAGDQRVNVPAVGAHPVPTRPEA